MTGSVLFLTILKASWVSRQKVVIETRMKNKEAKAINCSGGEKERVIETIIYFDPDLRSSIHLEEKQWKHFLKISLGMLLQKKIGNIN